MTTNTLVTESGSSANMHGVYNHNTARMWIPEENNIASDGTFVGEVRYIGSSGVLAIWNGDIWGTYHLQGVDTGIAPTHPDISGQLVNWVDAKTGGFALTGSGVDGWFDKSTHDWDLDDIDSTPFRGTDMGGTISGVHFDGVNDIVGQTTNNNPAIALTNASDQPMTIIIAYRALGTRAGTEVLWSIGSNVANVTHNLIGIGVNDEIQFGGRDDATGTINVYGNQGAGQDHVTNPQVLTATMFGTTATIFASGGAAVTAISGMDFLNNDCHRTALGGLDRFGFGLSSWFKGIIYSVAMFTSGLSTEHRQGVEKYFATQYNIPMVAPEDNL